MKAARLLRWYLRAGRERYGEELLALIQDTLDEGRPTCVAGRGPGLSRLGHRGRMAAGTAGGPPGQAAAGRR